MPENLIMEIKRRVQIIISTREILEKTPHTA
jgi:hypothetical protein